MTPRCAVLIVAASCGCSTYLGSSTRQHDRRPVLDGSQIRIAIEHEKVRSYRDDCGAARIFGVGEHDCITERSKSVGTEQVGVVVVDLRAGRCGYVPGRAAVSRPKRPTPARPVELAVHHGGRTFVATPDHVEERDAGGKTVAIHRQPIELLPENYAWLERTVWPVGATHEGRTLTRTDRGLALVSAEYSPIELGDVETVYWLGDTPLAVAEGMLIDVAHGWKANQIGQPIQGVPRVAPYVSDGWLINSDERYWYVEPRFGSMSKIWTEMVPIGVDGTRLVFQYVQKRLILIFDAVSRTWRQVPYASCMPAAPQ